MRDTALAPTVLAWRSLPAPPRLEEACARMAHRLADVLGQLGDPEGAAFLRSLPAHGGPAAPDGGCLSLPVGPAQPVDRLVAGLGLDVTERDLLVLALVAGHHEATAAVLRGLHPAGRPAPTVGLLGALADAGGLGGVRGRDDVVPALRGSRAVRAGLVRLEDPDAPWAERTLAAVPRLWDALAGLPGWPDGVTAVTLPLPRHGLDGWLADDAVAGATAAVAAGEPVTVLVAGARPDALAVRLATLAAHAGRTPAVLAVDRPLDGALVGAVLLLALARDVVPVLVAPADRPTGRPAGHLTPAAPELGVPLLVAAPDDHLTTWPRPVLRLPALPHTRDDRVATLHAVLPGADRPDRPLGPATLEPWEAEVAATDVRAAAAAGGTTPRWEALERRIDALTTGTVPAGAVLVHPRAGWDDLVLPPDRTAQLREAVDRMQHQDRVLTQWGFGRRHGAAGLRLLFAGPPGTGKTLAAEVLAGALGRDLLVVDLSRLVSKWIGETEKNLAAVFEAAERDGAVVLFDEADALFGRRTEVGDARDRYANLETAYLLSRLERFDGCAVLSTNLEQNLDPAFARRLEFVLPFDLPDVEQRLALWRRHVVDEALLAPDVDLAAFAAVYELSGALIRNAALTAAFLAAAGRTPAARRISHDHLVRAVRREHLKAGMSYPGPLPAARVDRPTRRG